MLKIRTRKLEMQNIIYVLVVGSLMYAQVCTHSDMCTLQIC
jgi:hypothetical protein